MTALPSADGPATEMLQALGLTGRFRVTGEGDFRSAFAVTDLLTGSIGAAGLALAQLMDATGLTGTAPAVTVDRRLASLWGGRSMTPVGWDLPPVWDAIAGDYETADGWIKLHTNLPHHRAAALSVLGVAEEREAVAAAVRAWKGAELEASIHEAGGVAAELRDAAAWLEHPNGKAVAGEPLIAFDPPVAADAITWPGRPDRPLAGLKVLDLTRVLAGPVATRFLAGFGAEVLRIDPPGWDEANIIPGVSLGKRMAVLDLATDSGRARLRDLLAEADVFAHGYRPGALAGLGFDEDTIRALNPGVVEVTLDAWGWTGPWNGRRGFDSLVQMSCGIAEAGMGWAGASQPTPLPVQALDHATGYLLAASALVLLRRAAAGQGGGRARLSLARTGTLLLEHPMAREGTIALTPREADQQDTPEATPWGEGRRLKPALSLDGAPMAWDRPSAKVGSFDAAWG